MQVSPQSRASTIQRSATNSGPVNAVPPIVHDVLNSSGQPLETGTREFMESRFERDLSQIPIHSKTPLIQTKLMVTGPSDQFEQEADSVAQKVVQRKPNSQPVLDSNSQLSQMTGTSITQTPIESGLEQDIESSRGGGQSLPNHISASLGQAIGADFSNVRVHTDSKADMLSRTLQARAFTTGQDIFFRQGEYAPASLQGQGLLAHELTHVTQQNSGKVSRRQLQRRILMPTATDPAVSHEVTRHERREFIRHHFSRTDRDEAWEIAEDMAVATDPFRFSDETELETEVNKRITTTRRMKQSQTAVAGNTAFGYPFTSPSLYWGPRVNYAARDYWTPSVPDNYSIRQNSSKRKLIKELPRHERHTVYGDPAPGYSWSLSATGKADPYEAISRLFSHQPPHKKTLIHCDYLVSLVHFMSFAKSIGRAEFNLRLTAFNLQPNPSGDDKFQLKWNGFHDLLLSNQSLVPGLNSLQKVVPSSESDLIIGDHVYFFNHYAYDLINERIRNAWRLENAVLVEKRNGHDIFLGHGSGKKTVQQMREKLAQEYNQVANRALILIAQTHSRNSQTRSHAQIKLQNDFPNVHEVGGQWKIQGVNDYGIQIDEVLRRIRPSEVVGLRDPSNISIMGAVYRPIESL
jgi:hypothetical protein